MPPAVKTDLAADIAEGDVFTLMTTDELVRQSFASLKAGALEIRPGQSKQLALMRRLAPDFINGQLEPAQFRKSSPEIDPFVTTKVYSHGKTSNDPHGAVLLSS